MTVRTGLWLLDLADVARRTGHPVVEVAGWRDRGHGGLVAMQGIVCHHTAGPATGDAPSLSVVVYGRSDLPGPLSQYVIGRTGTIYVVAAGVCWQNAPSTSPYHTNYTSTGIEAENTGTGQTWPPAQLDAYRRLCAELCRAHSLPAGRVRAHREVNTSKPDPVGIAMTAFRAAVADLLTEEVGAVEPVEVWRHQITRPDYAADIITQESLNTGAWLRTAAIQAWRSRLAADRSAAAAESAAATAARIEAAVTELRDLLAGGPPPT